MAKTLENNIIHVIAGNSDYKKGIKLFNDLKNNKDSIHWPLDYTFDKNTKYDKDSSLKTIISLCQLIHNDFKCAYCNQIIKFNDNVIISHNLGHNDNLTQNIQMFGIDLSKIFNNDDSFTLYNSLLKNNYIYSIIHYNCNYKHINDNDSFAKFEHLYLNNSYTEIDKMIITKFSKTRLRCYYYLTNEIIDKIAEKYKSEYNINFPDFREAKNT